MEVSLAVVADYASITREGKLNILGIFETISAREFPASHPQMQLVMRFEADSSEAGKKKELEIQFMDADGKKLFTLGGEFTVGQPPPGQRYISNHVVTINMANFERPGDYEFKILVNGDVKAEVPLTVIKISGV